MPHRFTFFRSGGFDQVLIASAGDIAHLHELDQKLWAALSCPVKGLEFDERTLALIDSDGDGRVRVQEVLAAIRFAQQHLTDLGAIIPGKDRLPLAAIAAGSPAGAAILACAKRILAKAGKPTATDLGLDDLAAAAQGLAETDFNGDGIVPPSSFAEPELRQLAADIIAVTGGEKDRAGALGVGAASRAAFGAAVSAYRSHRAAAKADPAIFPLGEAATAAAHAAVAAVARKLDDYYARCRLSAYDARAESALNRREEDFLVLAAKDLEIENAEIAAFPLARIAPDRPLPLREQVNPAWAAKVAALREQVVTPLLGERATLDEAGWRTIQARLAPYRAWLAARTPGPIDALGEARIDAIAATDAALAAIDAAIAKDLAVAPEFAALVQVETLIRLHRDLYRLLHNFVNFADFYSPSKLAVFQSGTMYFDARAFELCVRVEDAGKHAALAGLAKTYLAYCDCSRRNGSEKMTVCVAVTNGDSDFLMIGRNGVFYDRKGQDWDATITKIIENPISIREAFWAPYKKAVRFIEEMVAKRAAAADESANAKLQTAATTAAAAVETGKKPADKPKFEVGTVAALGVGLGAIGTLLGGFVTGFINLGWWIPLGLVGIVLGISLPACIIAALKLRLRNLGPILDANGWAINGRVKINIPFGTALSTLAVLPAGSSRSLFDPYAEKKKPWKTYVVLLVLLGLVGWLVYDAVTHERIRPLQREDKTWRWEPAIAPSATPAAKPE